NVGHRLALPAALICALALVGCERRPEPMLGAVLYAVPDDQLLVMLNRRFTVPGQLSLDAHASGGVPWPVGRGAGLVCVNGGATACGAVGGRLPVARRDAGAETAKGL